MGSVEDYISYYGAHQWQQLRTVFDHSDFKRIGYNDLFTDADKYVEYLEEIVPTFGADYELEVEGTVYTPREKRPHLAGARNDPCPFGVLPPSCEPQRSVRRGSDDRSPQLFISATAA
jgi:hypothetical protein